MRLTNYRGARYRAWLSEDLSAIIESKDLGLGSLQRNFLRSRWLQQVLRLDFEYSRALAKYQLLRLITVLGSITILMLVSLRVDDVRWAPLARYLTIFFSLLVSASVAIEHQFNFGERWRQAGQALERLTAEGWRFLELSGHYRHYENHADAFPAFANHVEDFSQREVEIYSPPVMRDRRKGGEPREVESPKKLELPLTGKEGSSVVTARPSAHEAVSRRVNQPPAR